MVYLDFLIRFVSSISDPPTDRSVFSIIYEHKFPLYILLNKLDWLDVGVDSLATLFKIVARQLYPHVISHILFFKKCHFIGVPKSL